MLNFRHAYLQAGGAACSGFGIYLLVEANKTAGTVSKGIPIFILATGLLIFFLGFLGCVGACCENSCMLKTFAIIIGVLLLAEIIGGILVLVYRHQFVSWTGTALKAQIDKLNEAMPNEFKDVRDAINQMQKELKCCGGTAASDWIDVPESCCKTGNSKCVYYKQGCAVAMYELIKNKALMVGLSLVLMCLLQIGAIVCACCLSKKIGAYESV